MSTANDIKAVWLNGKLVPYNEASVPLLTHSLHYGTGVFEGIRAYQNDQGQSFIYRGEDHFERFRQSIKILGLEPTLSVEQLMQATCEVVQANSLKECYIRPLAFVGDENRGLRLPPETRLQTAILAWSWGKYMGDEGQTKGIRVFVSSYRRPDVSSGNPWAKISGAYVTSVLARRQASNSGYDEALLLDQAGYVAEGSGENLFLVESGKLVTPPAQNILPGITRDSIIQLARDCGISVLEQNIIRNQAYVADEAFFTGTAVEVTPVVEIDDHKLGDGVPGPVSKKLMDLFFQSVRGELPAFKHWVTPV